MKEAIQLLNDIIYTYGSNKDKEIKEIVELSKKRLERLLGPTLAGKLLIMFFTTLGAAVSLKEPYNKVAWGLFIIVMLITFILSWKKVDFNKRG